MNKRKEKHYNKVVYKIDDTYYILDYIFRNSNDFMGATGSVVEIINQEEIDELERNWEGEEYWKMAVEGGYTTDSLSDWEESVRLAGECGVWEEYTGKSEHGIELKENEFLNCVGGGRCFDLENMKQGNYELVGNSKAIFDLIVKAESGTLTDRELTSVMDKDYFKLPR